MLKHFAIGFLLISIMQVFIGNVYWLMGCGVLGIVLYVSYQYLDFLIADEEFRRSIQKSLSEEDFD
jgi:mannose/fructose/N-acetylgalactosamine-specific phosphotransferase system component IIC